MPIPSISTSITPPGSQVRCKIVPPQQPPQVVTDGGFGGTEVYCKVTAYQKDGDGS